MATRVGCSGLRHVRQETSSDGRRPAHVLGRGMVSGPPSATRRRADRARDRSHLKHEPHLVRDPPVLHDPPALEPHDVDHVDLDTPAGRRVAHHGSGVDAPGAIARPDHVADGGQVLDRERELGHPAVERADDVLGAIRAGRVAALVLHAIRDHQLVDHAHVPVREALVDQPAESRLVVGGGHLIPLSCSIELYSIEIE